MGIGPAGLAAALALLSKGYSVHLIDSRCEDELFKRRQGVVINKDTIADFFDLTQLKSKGFYLNNRKEFHCRIIAPYNESSLDLDEEDQLDLSFFKLIENENTVVAVGDLQRYQYNKLKCIYARRGYTFNENSYEFTEEQQLVFHMGDAEIIEVQAQEQKITLKIAGEQQSYGFDLLIDASGKTAKSFTPIWNQQNPQFAIEYEKLENPEHNAFGIISLSIQNAPFEMIGTPVITPLDGKMGLSPVKVQELKELGWEHERSPVFFLKYSKTQQTVYAAGEIPECLLAENNPAKITQWFHRLMQLRLNNEKFRTKLSGLVSVFKIDIEIANCYAMPLPLGGNFCVIGDAFMPANFLLGHGIGNAFEDANELLEMVDNQFINQDFYREERVQEYREILSNFKDLIESNEQLAKLEYQLMGPK